MVIYALPLVLLNDVWYACRARSLSMLLSLIMKLLISRSMRDSSWKCWTSRIHSCGSSRPNLLRHVCFQCHLLLFVHLSVHLQMYETTKSKYMSYKICVMSVHSNNVCYNLHLSFVRLSFFTAYSGRRLLPWQYVCIQVNPSKVGWMPASYLEMKEGGGHVDRRTTREVFREDIIQITDKPAEAKVKRRSVNT